MNIFEPNNNKKKINTYFVHTLESVNFDIFPKNNKHLF